MTGKGDLFLGVDGGGSKTSAWLAIRDSGGQEKVIGRGRSGPSNCRSIGIEQATKHLQQAIDAAFQDAGREPTTVAAACLALAGADRRSEQQQIRLWAGSTLADRLTITNDAMPVLYAASRRGVGIALISGTGSLAVGRNADSTVLRCGGWGGLIGDEGSGYQIAITGLQAAVKAADGRGMKTSLLPAVLEHFHIADPRELIAKLYSPEVARSEIAELAPIVFRSAQSGDAAANQIIQQAALDLSELVITLAHRLGIATIPILVGVSGGVLLNQQELRDAIRERLSGIGLDVTIKLVREPVAGAITLAIAEHHPFQQ